MANGEDANAKQDNGDANTDGSADPQGVDGDVDAGGEPSVIKGELADVLPVAVGESTPYDDSQTDVQEQGQKAHVIAGVQGVTMQAARVDSEQATGSRDGEEKDEDCGEGAAIWII